LLTHSKELQVKTGTSDRAVKRSALGAVGVLALVAGLIPLPDAPGWQTMAQAAAANLAPVTTGPTRGLAGAAETRLAGLRRQLRITPEQEPQFQDYAAVIRTNAQKMQGLLEQRAKATDKSATARLRWYAQLSTASAENNNKIVLAFDALYQALSDSQKQAADTAFDPRRRSWFAPRHAVTHVRLVHSRDSG
jgi:protein CpxP